LVHNLLNLLSFLSEFFKCIFLITFHDVNNDIDVELGRLKFIGMSFGLFHYHFERFSPFLIEYVRMLFVCLLNACTTAGKILNAAGLYADHVENFSVMESSFVALNIVEFFVLLFAFGSLHQISLIKF
jgi:hypothetical protein